MIPGVNAPPNRSQRRIDEELILLEKRVLQLKTERNSCAGISKVPEDVLGEIFTLLARSCPLNSWFKINLVCRHWRDTALRTVVLWTNPPTYHHEFTMLMLERSKMADLRINLRSGTPPAITTTLLNHIGRTHSLSIAQQVDMPHAVEALKSLRHRSSRLEKLHIKFTDGSSSFSRMVSSASSIALRQFDWEVLPLPQLTQLSLEEIFLPVPITIHHLLLTLREMPMLQSFKLHADVIAHYISPLQYPHLKSVRLAYLSSFEIFWQATHHQVIYLLTHLELPHLSYLEIRCCSDEAMHSDGNCDFSPFMHAALSTLSTGDFAACDTLVVCSDNWFHLIPREHHNTPNFPSKGLVIDMLDYEGFENSNQNFTLEVVAALNKQILSRLVALEFYDLSPPIDDILCFFGRLPSLEYIEIEPGLIATLIKALSIPPNYIFGTPLTIFPKLQEINVPYRGAAEDPQMIQALYDSLKARNHSGVPIRKLYVNTSFMPENSVLRSFGDIGVELLDSKLR